MGHRPLQLIISRFAGVVFSIMYAEHGTSRGKK